MYQVFGAMKYLHDSNYLHRYELELDWSAALVEGFHSISFSHRIIVVTSNAQTCSLLEIEESN